MAALNGVEYSGGPIGSGSAYSGQNLVTQIDSGRASVGAVPSPNQDLYLNDPIYRQAWDQSLQSHINQFGTGYTKHSDINAINDYVLSSITKNPNYKAPTQDAIGGSSGAGGGADYSAFYDSPDYKFTFEQGNKAVNAGLAARGLSNSGRAMKELTKYGQGAASTQLNTYRNALAAMAGVGQTTATNLGNLGSNTASQVGQNTQNAADARASGYLGSANAWSSALNSGAGTAAYMYGRGGVNRDVGNMVNNSGLF